MDWEAFDDTNGEMLNPTLVKRARAEEVEYIRSMHLYDKVPIAESYERTGKGPIAGRWLDRNKGDKRRPNYRSRYVAKDFKREKAALICSQPPRLWRG